MTNHDEKSKCEWQIAVKGGIVFHYSSDISEELVSQCLIAYNRIKSFTKRNCDYRIDLYIYPTLNVFQAIWGERSILIDRENREIHAAEDDRWPLYILYLIDGQWGNYHPEWYQLLCSWADEGFAPFDEMRSGVEFYCEFPRIMFTEGIGRLQACFAGFLVERYGWGCIMEWIEKPDLIKFFRSVFSEDIEKLNLALSQALGANKAIPVPTIDRVSVQTTIENLFRKAKHNQYADLPDDHKLALYANTDVWERSEVEIYFIHPYSESSVLVRAEAEDNRGQWGIFHVYLDCLNQRWEVTNLDSFVLRYDAWERRRAEGYTRNNPYNEDGLVKKIIDICGQRGNRYPTLCEIGVGSGRIAKPFVDKGFSYVGIDRSRDMLAECRTRLGDNDNLVLIEADLADILPLPDNSVDVILEVRVFAEFPAKLLRECARVLRPKGFLLANVCDNLEYGNTYPSSFVNLVHCGKDFQIRANTGSVYRKFSGRNAQREAAVAKKKLPDGEKQENQPTSPPPDEEYSKDNWFSCYKYSYYPSREFRDNRYHMAFFRWEPALEPYGTLYFKYMENSAKTRLGSDFFFEKQRQTTAKLWNADTLKRWSGYSS